MTTTLIWLEVFGVVFMSATLAAWFYQCLFLDVFRRLIGFRLENNLDQLKLSGLNGEIQGRLFFKLKDFLEDAMEAPKAEMVFINLPKSFVQGKKIRIQELLEDMNTSSVECRELVGNTLHMLAALYLVQRPFLFFMILPLALLSIFAQRYRRKQKEKEVEFAASSLAAAFT